MTELGNQIQAEWLSSCVRPLPAFIAAPFIYARVALLVFLQPPLTFWKSPPWSLFKAHSDHIIFLLEIPSGAHSAFSVKSRLLVMVHKALHGFALPPSQPYFAGANLTFLGPWLSDYIVTYVMLWPHTRAPANAVFHQIAWFALFVFLYSEFHSDLTVSRFSPDLGHHWLLLPLPSSYLRDPSFPSPCGLLSPFLLYLRDPPSIPGLPPQHPTCPFSTQTLPWLSKSMA